MVQIVPMNYNNVHYKPVSFINEYPPMPIPMPMLIPHHFNYFLPPPPMYDPMFMPPADITVYVPTLQRSYGLNSSILSRSPVLFQRIREERTSTLELDLYVLPETFHTVIGHLNRPLTPQEILYLVNEKPHIAIELLEACEELGLEQLMNVLLAALNQHMNQSTVAVYIEAMEPYQPLEDEEPRRWVEMLEYDIVAFLIKTKQAFSNCGSRSVMIGQVNVYGCMASRTSSMVDDLARLYAVLPQHLMVRCLEHPGLPVQDAIQRWVFANKVLSHRQDQHGLRVIMRFEKGIDTIAVVKQTGLKKGEWNPKLY